MYLSQLKLRQFRNIEELELELSPGVTFITGSNAQGKTNILEAIDLLSRGASFRAKDYDLVKKGEDFYKVEGVVKHEDREFELSIAFKSAVRQKEVKLNKDRTQIKELVRVFPTVRFSPSDMNLVFDEPGKRRAALDELLVVLSSEYREALTKYKKALSQRSHVLWKIKEGMSQAADLDVWDEALIKYGAFICATREKKVNELFKVMAERYSWISKRDEDFSLRYVPSIEGGSEPARYREELARTRGNDLRLLVTSVGVHKDDFLFLLDELPMSTRSSRGEVRSAMLALKSAELSLLEQKTKTRPILLLDDVYSELDRGRQETLSEILDSQQTIVTTTEEPSYLNGRGGAIYEIKSGKLKTATV